MGRNRKPKAVAERDGSFEKHPERKAAYELEPKPVGPLGAPPSSFDPTRPGNEYTGGRLLEIWNEVVTQAPPGVLTGSDRLVVEMTCRAIFRIRYKEPKASDFSMVREFLGKMAMTPADRTKVQIAPGGAGGAVAPSAENKNEPEKAEPFRQLAAETLVN